MTGTQQTALDEFASEVHLNWSFSHSWALSNMTSDEVVAYTKGKRPDLFTRAIQAPRVIEYCKEQDRLQGKYWTFADAMSDPDRPTYAYVDFMLDPREKERDRRHKEVEHTLRVGGPYDCHSHVTQGMEEAQNGKEKSPPLIDALGFVDSTAGLQAKIDGKPYYEASWTLHYPTEH